MTGKFRKMKPYHPRRSSKVLKVSRLKLLDLEKKMKRDLGEYLLFLKEGARDLIDQSSVKVKTDLSLLGPDMEKLAVEIGGRTPQFVRDFLNRVDAVLGSPSYLGDIEQVAMLHAATERLEKIVIPR